MSSDIILSKPSVCTHAQKILNERGISKVNVNRSPFFYPKIFLPSCASFQLQMPHKIIVKRTYKIWKPEIRVKSRIFINICYTPSNVFIQCSHDSSK